MIRDTQGNSLNWVRDINEVREHSFNTLSIRRWSIFYSQYCIIVFNAYDGFETVLEADTPARDLFNKISRLPKSISEATKSIISNRWHMELVIEPTWSRSGLSDRTYGVEIECCFPSRYTRETMCEHLRDLGIDIVCTGYNHNDSYSSWKMTTDASVHTERVGYNTCEIVSPILQGDQGLTKINDLCRALDDCGFIVNRSCGFHVHHNARDLTDSQRLAIIDFYRINEQIFDSICSRSRRGNDNQYCLSLRGFNSRSIPNTRYTKVNGQAYSRHGTIEFRQHQGTVDYQKIANWIRLTQHVVELADTNKRSFTSLAQMFTALRLSDYIAYYEGRQRELA